MLTACTRARGADDAVLTAPSESPGPVPPPSHYDFPVSIAEDRSISIPPGAVVFTGYVRIDRISLACRERMAVGDVDRACQRRLQLAPRQPFPPPRGYWDGQQFVIVDGRHEYVAALMLGFERILVAWTMPAEKAVPCGS